MHFAAACYALSMEENVHSCGPAHVLDNTPLVPLLENSCFYIVVEDDRVQSFFFVRFSEEWACVLLLFIVHLVVLYCTDTICNGI